MVGQICQHTPSPGTQAVGFSVQILSWRAQCLSFSLSPSNSLSFTHTHTHICTHMLVSFSKSTNTPKVPYLGGRTMRRTLWRVSSPFPFFKFQAQATVTLDCSRLRLQSPEILVTYRIQSYRSWGPLVMLLLVVLSLHIEALVPTFILSHYFPQLGIVFSRVRATLKWRWMVLLH